MSRLRAFIKVFSKRSNISLVLAAIAAIGAGFGLDLPQETQARAAEMIASLVAILAIAFGIGQSEKEVKDEVRRDRETRDE